jgi:hypothetical protein
MQIYYNFSVDSVTKAYSAVSNKGFHKLRNYVGRELQSPYINSIRPLRRFFLATLK